ncbi:hypothetical protein DSO57_1018075 [Entomophthora muscae]|nr:hypothetical protein DSO57_1018075 [Entomophthora muscae]
MKQPFGLGLDLGQLGYDGLSDFPMSPVSDASQLSPIMGSASSLDLDFDTCNCVYCGVGLGSEAVDMEWEERVCELCTRALVCCLPRHPEPPQYNNMEHCHHCGISLDGVHIQVDRHAYCQFDYESLFVLHCRGCGTGIADSYVEALDAVWHKACFRCAECGDCVADGTSFLLDERILCERHYYHLLDAMCLICEKPLKGLCLSTPDGKSKFHPNHFQCYKCHSPLPQSNFTKESGHLICLDCTR